MTNFFKAVCPKCGASGKVNMSIIGVYVDYECGSFDVFADDTEGFTQSDRCKETKETKETEETDERTN